MSVHGFDGTGLVVRTTVMSSSARVPAAPAGAASPSDVSLGGLAEDEGARPPSPRVAGPCAGSAAVALYSLLALTAREGLGSLSCKHKLSALSNGGGQPVAFPPAMSSLAASVQKGRGRRPSPARPCSCWRWPLCAKLSADMASARHGGLQARSRTLVASRSSCSMRRKSPVTPFTAMMAADLCRRLQGPCAAAHRVFHASAAPERSTSVTSRTPPPSTAHSKPRRQLVEAAPSGSAPACRDKSTVTRNGAAPLRESCFGGWAVAPSAISTARPCREAAADAVAPSASVLGASARPAHSSASAGPSMQFPASSCWDLRSSASRAARREALGPNSCGSVLPSWPAAWCDTAGPAKPMNEIWAKP
mmetsp:Transcript_40383/g.112145  ORF Transcript_40383/g.112145 Transcript_40383/m.112145 type:complete len:363 (-) Transcript_40383:10-1098(-)